MARLITGTVILFSEEKGFGFIIPDDGSQDLFVDRGCINGTGILHRGDKVSFTIGQSNKGPLAQNVSWI